MLEVRSLTKIEFRHGSCLMIFPKFMAKKLFFSSKNPKPNFQNWSEWLLLEIKTNNLCTPKDKTAYAGLYAYLNGLLKFFREL